MTTNTDGDGTVDSVDDKVRLDIPARLIKEFSGGSALVDADGKVLLVAKDEWRYVNTDSKQAENHG